MDRRVLGVFLSIFGMFIAAQALGIYAGTFIIMDAVHNEVVSKLMVIPGGGPQGNPLLTFVYILAGAALFYLLIRLYKGDLLFILIEIGAVSVASSIVFYSFMRPWIADALVAMGLAAVAGIALAVVKFFLPRIRNAVAVIAAAGAGAVFGFSLSFETGLVLLVLMAVYDYIAVFKTRHMVEFAQSISKREMPFAISSAKKTERGVIAMELGTGDIIIPVMLEVSGAGLGLAYPAIVFMASAVSLLVLFMLLARTKMVLPALPIIAAVNLLFLGIAKLAGVI